MNLRVWTIVVTLEAHLDLGTKSTEATLSLIHETPSWVNENLEKKKHNNNNYEMKHIGNKMK